LGFESEVFSENLRNSSLGSGYRFTIAILTEPDLVKKLPRVQRRATVISGSIAAPFIEKVLSSCGSQVPVIPVTKEIACLITIDDFRKLDLSTLEPVVIIPGRSFVHDTEVQEVLFKDV